MQTRGEIIIKQHQFSSEDVRAKDRLVFSLLEHVTVRLVGHCKYMRWSVLASLSFVLQENFVCVYWKLPERIDHHNE